MRRTGKKSAIAILSLALFVFVSGLSFAWLVGHDFIVFPYGPSTILMYTFTIVLFMTVVGILAMITSMGCMSGSSRMGQPKSPEDGVFVRAVRLRHKRREYLIRGDDDDTVRSVIKDQWPFEEIDCNESWYCVDERGNDISDLFISEVDGILTVVVPRYSL